MKINELVERCKRGDEQAMSLLYRCYAGRLSVVCRRMLGSENDVQDIVHDAFILIFTQLHTLKKAERLEPWMVAIVRNLVLKHLQQPVCSTLDDIDLPCQGDADETGFAELMAMIELLPTGYRNVFKLSVLEGRSHKEIAEMLGIAAHSSSSQLTRAKKMMRQMLRRYWLVAILLLALVSTIVYFVEPLEETQTLTQAQTKTKTQTRSELKEAKKEIKVEPQNKETKSQAKEVKAQDKEIELRPEEELQGKVIDLLAEKEEQVEEESTQEKPEEIFDFSPLNTDAARDLADIVLKKPKSKKTWKILLSGALSPALAQNIYRLATSTSTTTHKPNTPDLPFDPNGEYQGPDIPNNADDHYVEVPGSTDSPTDSEKPDDGSTPGNKNPEDKNPEDSETTTITERRKAHHETPITVGFSLTKRLSDHWSIETGLQYTQMRSTFSVENDAASSHTRQCLHYLGIPLRASYRYVSLRRFSPYVSGGIVLNIPLYGKSEMVQAGDKTAASALRQIHGRVQWTTNISLGLQYQFLPRWSFYVEPTLNYHIPSGGQIRTYWSERFFTFSVPLGIRFTW